MSAFNRYVSVGGIVAALCLTSAAALAAKEVTEVSGYLGPDVYKKL